jgi:hypothetical protein
MAETAFKLRKNVGENCHPLNAPIGPPTLKDKVDVVLLWESHIRFSSPPETVRRPASPID